MADQVFDLGPEVGVALAFHVAGGEYAIAPGGVGTIHRSFLVVHEEVAEDLSFGGIGGGDTAASVNDAVGLVEIYGGGDVVGNDGIVLPDFGDAIDLHGERDGDAFAAEITSEENGGSGSPAVAEQNDVSASLFGGGESAVAIGIEKMDDGIVSALPAAVLKNPDIRIFILGKVALDALRELNRAMVGVVVRDETSNEADHDIRRRAGVNGGTIGGARERGQGGEQNRKGGN